MYDLSHIGRPGANEGRRIASPRRRNMPLQLDASERGESGRKYFRARGFAQVIDKAQFGQGNPRKTKPFSWIGFAQAWPDLAEFGFGLDRAWSNFNMHNTQNVQANSRRRLGKRFLRRLPSAPALIRRRSACSYGQPSRRGTAQSGRSRSRASHRARGWPRTPHWSAGGFGRA